MGFRVARSRVGLGLRQACEEEEEEKDYDKKIGLKAELVWILRNPPFPLQLFDPVPELISDLKKSRLGWVGATEKPVHAIGAVNTFCVNDWVVLALGPEGRADHSAVGLRNSRNENIRASEFPTQSPWHSFWKPRPTRARSLLVENRNRARNFASRLGSALDSDRNVVEIVAGRSSDG